MTNRRIEIRPHIDRLRKRYINSWEDKSLELFSRDSVRTRVFVFSTLLIERFLRFLVTASGRVICVGVAVCGANADAMTAVFRILRIFDGN